MGREAVKIAKAVNYVGAGTVEFLLSDVDKSFYFLEMNTRLQVEHAVTELVTGIDLVQEQISVANGEQLSFSQEDISIRGHAIECRIYAEDPENNFLPSPGKITRLRIPQGGGVRDDGGVYEGSEVSIYYDPMISKLCVHGRNRQDALNLMRRALREYEVVGIKTTLPFFREVMEDSEFIEGKIDTGFIEAFNKRRKKPEADDVSRDMALIASAVAYSEKQKTASNSVENQGTSQSRWKLSGRLDARASRL
jgi:acetyl-CoA carboxylase biotin carboxylase subunit